MTDKTAIQMVQQINGDTDVDLFDEIDEFWAKIPEDDAQITETDEPIAAPRGIHVLPS